MKIITTLCVVFALGAHVGAEAASSCSVATIDYDKVINALRSVEDGGQLLKMAVSSDASLEKIENGMVNSSLVYGQNVYEKARATADLLFLYREMRNQEDRKLVDEIASVRAAQYVKYLSESTKVVKMASGVVKSSYLKDYLRDLLSSMYSINEALKGCQ